LCFHCWILLILNEQHYICIPIQGELCLFGKGTSLLKGSK
jgi:hypothetical protein